MVCNYFCTSIIYTAMPCLQLSDSNSQERKSSGAVSVSTVVSSATPSPVNSMSEMSQAQPAAPQLTQPSISPQLQAGVTETVDNMGASPAPESKESIEFVPLFLLQ